MQNNSFEVTLNEGHALPIPAEIALSFITEGHKRVRILAKHRGRSISFHGAIHKWNENYLLSFGKRYQKELGVVPTDKIEIAFFVDTSKYGVDMPEELEEVLLTDHAALQIFESFTDGKKRGIIYSIARYKNSQTRIDKSLLLCENLKRGIRKNPDLLKSN